MNRYTEFAVIYFAAISIISVIVCIYDKIMAIKHKRRVRESTLIWLSVFGGSVFMLITMKIIRHKTLHKKFMIGIPLIIFLQIVVLFFVFYVDKIYL